MKIYILTDGAWHDNENYFGAYTTEEKARQAMETFIPHNEYSMAKQIIEIEVDAPAKFQCETIILEAI